MNELFYNVEQISDMLSMHPKTIQRYIREGKLIATKIGKSWRVSSHNLSLFIESNNKEDYILISEPIKASSVVDIVVSNSSEAISIINHFNSAMNMQSTEYTSATLHSQFLEKEKILRLTLWGNGKFMEYVYSSINTFMENRRI